MISYDSNNDKNNSTNKKSEQKKPQHKVLLIDIRPWEEYPLKDFLLFFKVLLFYFLIPFIFKQLYNFDALNLTSF